MSASLLIEPTHDEISNCAYFHWQEEGSPWERDQQYWFAAETELMQRWLATQGTMWTRESEHLAQVLTRVTMRV